MHNGGGRTDTDVFVPTAPWGAKNMATMVVDTVGTLRRATEAV